MISHASRTVDDTDFLLLIVVAWCVIHHMSYFRETRWLKAVLITYRCKTSLDDKTDRTFWLKQRFKCKISLLDTFLLLNGYMESYRDLETFIEKVIEKPKTELEQA